MTTPEPAPTPLLSCDWRDLGYPIHWSRYQALSHGQPVPPLQEHPLDLAAPTGTPDGNYTVAYGQGRSIGHKAIVKEGILDAPSTAPACYEAIWRGHGLTPEFPPRPDGPVVHHIFVEELSFDHHEGVLRIFCGS